jgi:hypothetical protein
VDIDEEHTKLLTYQRCLGSAVARADAVALLRAGLSQVLEGPAPSGQLTGVAAEESDLMMNQANYRAALHTLRQPVQRSLRDFVG